MKGARPFPLLVAGTTVEVPETGARYLVERVGSCSATVRPLAAESQRHIVIRDPQTKEVVREFDVATAGHRLEWSPRACVRVVS